MQLIFSQEEIPDALFVENLGEVVVQVVTEESYKKQVLKGYVPINENNASMYAFVVLKTLTKSGHSDNKYIDTVRELLEDAILVDSTYCYLYATDTLKSRFHRAEKMLMDSPDIVQYTLEFPEQDLIDIILTSTENCRRYAMFMEEHNHSDQVLDIVKNDTSSSLSYAIKINARFLLGEDTLSRDTEYGLVYAQTILKDRFPEYEKYHNDNFHTLDVYDLGVYKSYNEFFDIE